MSLDKPLIVTEGKTDNIYLRSALKALYTKYPELVHLDKGKLISDIQFLRHSRVEHDILELSGGSGNLGTLIGRYEKALYRYAHRPLRSPVIVLIDNDSGSDLIFATLKKRKITISSATTDAFYYVCFNLYVVKTPELGAKGVSCIEDLFDPSTRAIKLDGRSLSLDKEYDIKTHYGKMDFADKIIRANLTSINFTDFEPLFDRLVAVVKDYKLKKM